MTTYVIGDIQGCYDGLYRLLKKLDFRPGKDCLWLTGDLVNRGGQSLEVLRLVYSLRNDCVCVLGNHDISLLAYAHGVHKSKSKNREFDRIIKAVDGPDLLHWLQQQPLVHYDKQTLMVHAGISPLWGLNKTLRLAGEVEHILRSKKAPALLKQMWDRRLNRWNGDFSGMQRASVILNHLTRIRYCRKNHSMDFKYNGAPGTQPKNLTPWFSHPNRKQLNARVVFGHWSTLGFYHDDAVTCLDTGYVWGQKLTAINLKKPAKPIQVKHR